MYEFDLIVFFIYALFWWINLFFISFFFIQEELNKKNQHINELNEINKELITMFRSYKLTFLPLGMRMRRQRNN